MRCIDAHVHVGSWRLPEFAGHSTSLEDLEKTYTRWAFSGALVFVANGSSNSWLLENLPQRPDGLKLRRAFWARADKPLELELLQQTLPAWAALKIHPSIQRLPLLDCLWDPWLEIARRETLPVVVHCGRWTEMSGFLQVTSRAQNMPDVNFILGHMGGDSPHLVRSCVKEIQRLELSNCFLGTESIREPWVLEYAIEHLGAEKLIFGSDYNLNHPEVFKRMIEVLELDQGAQECILWKNINSLLPQGKKFFAHEDSGDSH